MIARVLLAVCTTVLLLGSLEGGARFYEGRPPWEAEFAAKKPGVIRIAVVGGSTAKGTPVLELGFVSQLEALLPPLAGFSSVEVVNLGKQATASRWALRTGEYVLAAGGLDALVVLTAHNEFLNRSGEASAVKGWIWEGMLHSALIRLVLMKTETPRPALPERLYAVDRKGDWFRERLAAYGRNLRELVREARARNVPILVLTAPVNLADWPPVHHNLAWDHVDLDYDAHVDDLRALVEAGDLDSAERMADSWRREFGEDAMFTFLEGQIARSRGNPESARRLLRRAADLDPYPWRVLSEQNEFIRELAAGDEMELVDVEEAFARRAPDGIVGFDLVGDNVHPTPLGGAVMALEVARGLRRAGLPLTEPSSDLAEQLDDFLGNFADRRELEHMRLMLSGRYAMKTPFYLYGSARRYLEAAHAVAPERWMALANLGSLSLLEGKTEAGLAQLRDAARLRGEPIDPADRRTVPMLGAALEQAGLPAEIIYGVPKPQ